MFTLHGFLTFVCIILTEMDYFSSLDLCSSEGRKSQEKHEERLFNFGWSVPLMTLELQAPIHCTCSTIFFSLLFSWSTEDWKPVLEQHEGEYNFHFGWVNTLPFLYCVDHSVVSFHLWHASRSPFLRVYSRFHTVVLISHWLPIQIANALMVTQESKCRCLRCVSVFRLHLPASLR